jgi:hypothetical protein
MLLVSFSLWSQKISKGIEDYRIPRNIERGFRLLDKTMTETEKCLIRTLPEDSIYFHKEFRNGADFYHAWKLYDGSRLTKYLNKKGFCTAHEMYETILISYHRYLNDQNVDLNGQVEKYKKIRREEHESYLIQVEKDSINGVYIPENLDDCFIQLDKLLSNDDKQYISELEDREEMIEFHHGLGTWIRNNWGLWGGSRLQKYFIEKGITHPDDMSGLILESYYDWLIRDNP